MGMGRALASKRQINENSASNDARSNGRKIQPNRLKSVVCLRSANEDDVEICCFEAVNGHVTDNYPKGSNSKVLSLIQSESRI